MFLFLEGIQSGAVAAVYVTGLDQVKLHQKSVDYNLRLMCNLT